METQNQIKRTLCRPEALEQIRQLLDGTDNLNRTALADQLCERFRLFDPRGGGQRSGCPKALRELERQSHFLLPAPRVGPGQKTPRRLGQPVPAPQAVPGEAGEVGQLRLIVVDSLEQMRIWNELLIREHPRGAGPLVGRQLRYLVASERGWLGAAGFSAAALQLQDRDRWIGWDVQSRRPTCSRWSV